MLLGLRELKQHAQTAPSRPPAGDHSGLGRRSLPPPRHRGRHHGDPGFPAPPAQSPQTALSQRLTLVGTDAAPFEAHPRTIATPDSQKPPRPGHQPKTGSRMRGFRSYAWVSVRPGSKIFAPPTAVSEARTPHPEANVEYNFFFFNRLSKAEAPTNLRRPGRKFV